MMTAPLQPFALDHCEVELAPGQNRRELLVFLASGRNFTMRRRPFSRDVLHVAARNSPYYLQAPQALADALTAVASGYERVMLFGASKSGFAALLLARLMAPHGFQRVLVMNPQVRLWPYDETLPFPSYQGLLERAARNAALMANLQALGDNSVIGEDPNVHATVVHAALNAVDAAQAALLAGRNIRHIPLHTDTHNAALFFGPRPFNPERMVANLEARYGAGGGDDEDLAATRPDFGRLVSDIAGASWLPSFEDLIDQVIGVNPPSQIPSAVAT